MKGSLPDGAGAHDGYWLDRVRKKIRASFEAALAKDNLPLIHWEVLLALYREEASTLTELAHLLRHDSGAMSRVLDQMEERGSLARRRKPSDQRVIRVIIPEATKALMPEIAGVLDENDRRVFGALSSEEMATLAFGHASVARLRRPGSRHWQAATAPCPVNRFRKALESCLD